MKYTQALNSKNKTKTNQQYHNTTKPTTTDSLYRRMKFLPPPTRNSHIAKYSGSAALETYLDNTKQQIADNLSALCHSNNSNLTREQQRALKKLQRANHSVTINPADKNLGLVLMDTEDYITQCLVHLTDQSTYRPAMEYPKWEIQRSLSNVLTNFKQQLDNRDKRLFPFLLGKPKNTRIPRFYGIPKIHKKFSKLPPLRPIVSQSASLLSPSAKFLDYVLQPIASTYPDYLHNSTALLITLQDFHIPEDSILVTIDVSSLYPSIPQTECLQIIYKELHKQRHLLTFDPNFIIQLLDINVNHNYFTFGEFTFQQIEGTAMGAPFSPTIANIFLSKTLDNFLQTQHTRPLIIKRYIDDIFMIWTDTPKKLEAFLSQLNKFHPRLHFTSQQSFTSIDFLDLTIYKGPFFEFTHTLDTKTFQKQLNLYQYLHFSSHHEKKVFKAIIKGECARYVRTNSTLETYTNTLHFFKTRLQKRSYPTDFIEKTTANIKFKNRENFLQAKKPQQYTISPPLYKYLPPSQYTLLKHIVIQDYTTKLHFTCPRFVALRHPTLQNKLVRSHLTLTDEQWLDVTFSVDSPNHQEHTTTAKLPQLQPQSVGISACKHPRCCTCNIHLNCSSTFTSNHPYNRIIFSNYCLFDHMHQMQEAIYRMYYPKTEGQNQPPSNKHQLKNTHVHT